MNFLPEGYEVPVTGGAYLNKFPEGVTKIRILSNAILGWRYFNTDNKPVRMPGVEPPHEQPVDAKTQPSGEKDKPKHFWAFVVWNYSEKQIQIAEISQATIQNGIKALAQDESWGDPKQYDITVSRTGKGFNDTEYNVIPNPPTEISYEIAEAFAEKNPNLKALFKGEDPFAKSASKSARPPLPNEEVINVADIHI